MASMIEVKALTVHFGDFHALKSVSFNVDDGKAFGLVGESGSGKSTLLRTMAGLNARWSGAMRIDGELLGARRTKQFFHRVQMVFQDPYGSLHPRQTIDRALTEPLIVHGIKDIDERIGRALTDVGLPAAVRYRFPHQLSGGQRQRVAIARALIADPKVLLLDEPTSALDVSVQAEVLNLLADLRESKGLTYVMVGHNLAAVAHLCDEIGVMQDGKLVERVSSQDLREGRVKHEHTARLRLLSVELVDPVV